MYIILQKKAQRILELTFFFIQSPTEAAKFLHRTVRKEKIG